MSQWWSWVLTIISVSGLWIAGSGKRWGWAVNLCNQVLWFAYAIVSDQYGFLVGASVYTVVYARNFLRRSETGPNAD